MSRFILMRSITFGWDKSRRSSDPVKTGFVRPTQLRMKMEKIDGRILYLFDGVFDLFVWKKLRRGLL